MATKPLNEHLDASLELLRKYQTGEIKLVKTNRPWLDNAGGIIPRSIIGILGASFSGKTTELQSLTEDIMDVEINEDAGDYVGKALNFNTVLLFFLFGIPTMFFIIAWLKYRSEK